MTQAIRVLDDHTINLIAAGEVIEDPSSVVKELIDNAIDANATRIHIEILGGGFFRIQIRDNGKGMTHDDVILSVERHATSKLKNIKELSALASMGFRGEALASIAAVSKLELLSAIAGDVKGTSVTVHGGKLLRVDPCARESGTTVTVDSLFYNVPARKEFQKSVRVCTNEIAKIVIKEALAFPEVAFTLVSQDATLLQTSEQKGRLPFLDSLVLRTQEVLEGEYAEGTRLEFSEEHHSLVGLLGHPKSSRGSRVGQYLFVNRRPVVSRLVADAIKEAYGTRIDQKKYPIFVLHLTLPASVIDVNVHPQKREIRFRDEEKVMQFVKKAISITLQSSEKLPFVSIDEVGDFDQLSDTENAVMFSFEEEIAPVNAMKQMSYDLEIKDDDQCKAALHLENPLTGCDGEVEVIDLLGPYALARAALDPFQTDYTQSVFIVDLPALRARYIYDAVLGARNGDQNVEVQQFMFPEIVEFSLPESKLVEANEGLLRSLGISLRVFGANSFLLEGLSPYYRGDDIKDFILELLPKIAKGFAVAEEMQEQIALLASKYARFCTGGFSLDEAKDAINQFIGEQRSSICPRGRAIVRFLDEETLKGLFT